MSDFPSGLNPDDDWEEQQRLAKLLEELNEHLKGFGSRQHDIYKKLSNLDEGHLNHIVKSLKDQERNQEKLFSHLLHNDREDLKLMKAMMGVMENHVAITKKLLDVSKKDENNLRNFLNHMESPAFQAKARSISNSYAVDQRNLQNRNFGESLKDIMSNKDTGFDYSTIASMLFGSRQKYTDEKGRTRSTWVRRQGADVMGSHAHQMRAKQGTLKQSYDMEYSKFMDDEYAKSMGIHDYGKSVNRQQQEEQAYWQKAYDASGRKAGEGSKFRGTASVPSQALLPSGVSDSSADEIVGSRPYQLAFEATTSSAIKKDALLGLPKAYAEPAIAIINALEALGRGDDPSGRRGSGGGGEGGGLLGGAMGLLGKLGPAGLGIAALGAAAIGVANLVSDISNNIKEANKNDAVKVQELYDSATAEEKSALQQRFGHDLSGGRELDITAYLEQMRTGSVSAETLRGFSENRVAGDANRNASGFLREQAMADSNRPFTIELGPSNSRVVEFKVQNGRFWAKQGNGEWQLVPVHQENAVVERLRRRSQILSSQQAQLNRLPANDSRRASLTEAQQREIRESGLGDVAFSRSLQTLNPTQLRNQMIQRMGSSTWKFDQGGVVPGEVGKAVPATVHAGETVIPTHKDSVRRNLDTLINSNIKTANLSTEKMEELLQKLVEVNEAIKTEMEKNTQVTEEVGTKQPSTSTAPPTRAFPVSTI